MAGARYSHEELLALRESPLVKKPDDLPSIDHWLECDTTVPPSLPLHLLTLPARQSSQSQSELPPQSQSQAQPPQQQQQQQQPPIAQRRPRNPPRDVDNPVNTPMGNFAQRPSLLQTRHASRSSATGSGMSMSLSTSKTPSNPVMTTADLSRVATNLVRTLQADGFLEDILLAPPKTTFASSRNLTRLASDPGDKLASTAEEQHPSDQDHPPVTARSRFFQERNAAKTSAPLKSDRDAWRVTRAAAAAAAATDDDERNGDKDKDRERDRDRDRDRFALRRGDRNPDHEDSGTRRNGYGHSQRSADQRWPREGDRTTSKMGDGQRGGWRDRERTRNEQQQHQQHQHHYGRDAHAEKDPEWFDEPAMTASKDDMGSNSNMAQMKTVDDFEAWKEQMKRKSQPASAAAAARGEPKDEMPAPPEPMSTPVKGTSTTPASPMVSDTGFDKLFGTWGQPKPIESPADPMKHSKAPGTGNAKAKSSRFASMFAPKDEARFFDEPASPLVARQMPAADGSDEDKQGFARIMAMLGKPTISSADDASRNASSPAAGGMAALFGPPPPPLPPPTIQQNRPPSLHQTPQEFVNAMFDHKPSSTANANANNPRSRPESAFGPDVFVGPNQSQEKVTPLPAHLGSHPGSSVASPDPSRFRSENGSKPPPPPPQQQQQQFPFLDQQAQQRNMAQTPESLNVQQIVAGKHTQKPSGALNKDSEFLLNLISQRKSTNSSAVQQNHQVGQESQAQAPAQAHAQQQQHQNQHQSQHQNQHHTQQGQQTGHDEGFQLFLDQPPLSSSASSQRKPPQSTLETHAPKPQQPHRVPGALEEQLFKGGIPQMNPQQHHHHHQEAPSQPQPQRQRVPPGFFDDPSIMQHAQNQRSFPPPPPQLDMHQAQQNANRRQSAATSTFSPDGHVPQNFAPFPPGFMGPPPGPAGVRGGMDGSSGQGAALNERLPPPPPGFNPNLRHPPGFAGIPGIFQPPQPTSSGNQQQQQQQQQQQPDAPRQQQNMMNLPPMMQQPGVLAQMQAHVTSPGAGPLSPQAQIPMGPPPPGFPMGINMNMPPPPPPGFFGPPPGFGGPAGPGAGGALPGMMGGPLPPGLVAMNGPGPAGMNGMNGMRNMMTSPLSPQEHAHLQHHQHQQHGGPMPQHHQLQLRSPIDGVAPPGGFPPMQSMQGMVNAAALSQQHQHQQHQQYAAAAAAAGGNGNGRR